MRVLIKSIKRYSKESTVLIAGIGGLGGTAAMYLAVAGIGRMVFAHYGDLTLSNMNRQILMRHGLDWEEQGYTREKVYRRD